MSKTSIDFFSKGLQDHKTKLAVSLFDLDIKQQIKQSPLKTKTSLSNISYKRFDKKQKKSQQQYNKTQNGFNQTNMQNMFNSTFISRSSSGFSGTHGHVKRNSIQFQTDDFNNKSEHAVKFVQNNSQKQYNFIPFPKITQQVQHYEQSQQLSNNEELKLSQNRQDAVLQKINQNDFNNNSNKQKLNKDVLSQSSRNFYFIRNLVLDSNQKDLTQRKNQIREFQPIAANPRYLQPIRSNSTEKNKKQQILQPYSLKAYRLSFQSLHQNNNPYKKPNQKITHNAYFNGNKNWAIQKQKDPILPFPELLKNESIKIKFKTKQTKILKVPGGVSLPKQTLQKKNINELEYRIDRWQYAKEDYNGLEL